MNLIMGINRFPNYALSVLDFTRYFHLQFFYCVECPSNGVKTEKVKHFRVNIAKALIGGVSSTASAKRRRIENLSVAPENKGKHFSCKIKGRKKVCVHCKRVGRKIIGRRSVETTHFSVFTMYFSALQNLLSYHAA